MCPDFPKIHEGYLLNLSLRRHKHTDARGLSEKEGCTHAASIITTCLLKHKTLRKGEASAFWVCVHVCGIVVVDDDAGTQGFRQAWQTL